MRILIVGNSISHRASKIIHLISENNQDVKEIRLFAQSGRFSPNFKHGGIRMSTLFFKSHPFSMQAHRGKLSPILCCHDEIGGEDETRHYFSHLRRVRCSSFYYSFSHCGYMYIDRTVRMESSSLHAYCIVPLCMMNE